MITARSSFGFILLIALVPIIGIVGMLLAENYALDAVAFAAAAAPLTMGAVAYWKRRSTA